MANIELIQIIEKFAESGWDLIDAPSKAWLTNNAENKKDEDITSQRPPSLSPPAVQRHRSLWSDRQGGQLPSGSG